jgi:hypothetical protein
MIPLRCRRKIVLFGIRITKYICLPEHKIKYVTAENATCGIPALLLEMSLAQTFG